jgi:hypothetical protein
MLAQEALVDNRGGGAHLAVCVSWQSVVGRRCALWVASAFSPQHGPGCSHPPALGKSISFRGTPPETPGREGDPPSALSLNYGTAGFSLRHERCRGRGRARRPTYAGFDSGPRDESHSLSDERCCARRAASALSAQHERCSSHPPALGVFWGIWGCVMNHARGGAHLDVFSQRAL